MSEHVRDELLSAHLDGALVGSEVASVDGHLHSCADCRRRLERLRATSRAVAALPGEPPGALDLSFLPPAPSTVVALPTRSAWRAPNWAIPVLAAAAVVVIAAGVGTLALRHPGGDSGAATALSTQDRANRPVVPPGSGSVADGGAGAAAQGAAPVTRSSSADAPSFTSNQFVAGTGGPATNSRSFPANGSASVTLSASPGSAPRGRGIQVSMSVRAGSEAIAVTGLQVTVRRATASTVVLGTGAQTVPAGHVSSLYGTWVAGQLGGDNPAAGDYRLEAHVLLADGTDLSVDLTVRVS